MADGQYPIADLQLVAVAQDGGGQAMVGLDPQHGKVGLFIGLDVCGTKLLAVGEFHQDFIGPFDDMIVGEDDALGVDDDAGTEPGARGRVGRRETPILVVEEVLNGRVRRIFAGQLRVRAKGPRSDGGLDLDHAGNDPLGNGPEGPGERLCRGDVARFVGPAGRGVATDDEEQQGDRQHAGSAS